MPLANGMAFYTLLNTLLLSLRPTLIPRAVF